MFNVEHSWFQGICLSPQNKKKQTLITSVLYSFQLISLTRLINFVVVDLRQWREDYGEFAFRFRRHHRKLGDSNLNSTPRDSGVTTMGSDRENPGAPNGGAQAVEQKHWPLTCYNVVF